MPARKKVADPQCAVEKADDNRGKADAGISISSRSLSLFFFFFGAASTVFIFFGMNDLDLSSGAALVKLKINEVGVARRERIERQENGAFMKWAEEELGITTLFRLDYAFKPNPQDAAAEPFRMRATFARRDIEEGEIVLSIPLERGGLSFYPAIDEPSKKVFDAVHQHLRTKEVRAKLDQLDQDVRTIIKFYKQIIALLYHLAVGKAGPLSGYIEHSILPMTSHHLYTKTSREDVIKAFPPEFGFAGFWEKAVDQQRETAYVREVLNPFLLERFPWVFSAPGKS